MNLSPEIVIKCDEIGRELTEMLRKKISELFSDYTCKNADNETLELIPIFILSTMVSVNSWALFSSYKEAGNELVTPEKVFNLLVLMAKDLFYQLKTKHRREKECH
jgi:hypothetical protein